jgi:hypothetical protein
MKVFTHTSKGALSLWSVLLFKNPSSMSTKRPSTDSTKPGFGLWAFGFDALWLCGFVALGFVALWLCGFGLCGFGLCKAALKPSGFNPEGLNFKVSLWLEFDETCKDQTRNKTKVFLFRFFFFCLFIFRFSCWRRVEENSFKKR